VVAVSSPDRDGLLILGGEKVFHLMGKDRLEEAAMTPAAEPAPNGLLVYPRIEGVG